MIDRRQFIKRGSAALITANTVVSPSVLAALSTPVDIYPRAEDPFLKDLASSALDSAIEAGASYADVRLTVTRSQAFYYANAPVETEKIAVGVRALANGSWGFTASADWTPEEMVRLGREAVKQAKGNLWEGVSHIEIGEGYKPAAGTWKMPIRLDPFSVSVEEKLDYIRAAEAYVATFRHASASSIVEFERQERTFASTEGAFCTQTVYNSLGGRSYFSVTVSDPYSRRSGRREVEFFSPTGAGYEIFEQAKLLDQIPRLYEEAKRMIGSEPVIPSRYDVVMDGYAMASILNDTVGRALEIDRALGYEANDGGTSYLAPLDRTLGKPFAPDFLTVSANRSHPTGAATVKWDDEGVEPAEFDLVREGKVVNYLCSREHTGHLNAWYEKNGVPVKSNGCAASQDAMAIQMVHSPNIVMHGAAEDRSFEDLVATLNDGIAVIGGVAHADYQQLNGQGMPDVMYRIRKGKLAEVISGGGFWFRAPELWQDLVAIGGEKSACWRGITNGKGQPRQETVHSVRGVAGHFKNVRVVDVDAGSNFSYLMR